MKWVVAILTRWTAILFRSVVSKMLRKNEKLMNLPPWSQAYSIKTALQVEFDFDKGTSLVVLNRNGFPVLFLRGVYGELHLIRVFA
ncbi:hypothetical protein [Achromobacter phage shaaii_LB5]|nr:hypothetical protein [Achromobacter phage shaaii_LB5]